MVYRIEALYLLASLAFQRLALEANVHAGLQVLLQ